MPDAMSYEAQPSQVHNSNFTAKGKLAKVCQRTWNAIPIVILLASFALFFIATALFPKCTDDFLYSYVWGKGSQRIEGISDILISQANHYMTWGGRFWTHCVVQYILMYDKAIFDILNLSCYAICTYYISRIMRPSFSLWRWCLVSISLWHFMPHTGSTMFWLTGSINYLWASCLNAVFLFLIYTGKKVPIIAMCALGIIAGNAHEGISAGILVTLSCLLLLRKRKRKTYILFIATYALGFLMNALAPGNYMRLEGADGIDSIDLFSTNILAKLYILIAVFVQYTISHHDLQLILLLLTISLVVAIYLLRINKKKAIIIFSFILGALASLTLNVMSGILYPRTMYGLFFISFIIVGIICSTVLRVRFHKRMAAILLVTLAYENAKAIPQAYASISNYKRAITYITEETLKEKNLIKYPEFLNEANEEYIEPWGINQDAIVNRPLAKYHGGVDFSVLKEDNYILVQNILKQIKNIKTNTILNLDNHYHVIRLNRLPTNVSAILPLQESSCRFAFVRKYIQTKPQKLWPFVICNGSDYYILWHTPKKSSTVTVTFSDGDILKLPLPDNGKGNDAATQD